MLRVPLDADSTYACCWPYRAIDARTYATDDDNVHSAIVTAARDAFLQLVKWRCTVLASISIDIVLFSSLDMAV